VGRGICGAAAAEKATIVVDDVNADPRYLACSLDTRSEIVVPIMRKGEVLGELDVDSDRPAAFGPEDKRLLGKALGSRSRFRVPGSRFEVRGARCEVRGARCEVRGSRFWFGARSSCSLFQGAAVIERRTMNREVRTPNREPPTPNLEPRTSNLEPRTSSLEPRTSNLEPRTRTGNLEPGTRNNWSSLA
jgi:hypothetical protein